MRLFENADYRFISKRKIAFIVSLTIIIGGMISFAWRGIETGIDFLGGTEFVVESDVEMVVPEVRAALAEPLGGDPEVKSFDDDILIRTTATGEPDAVQQAVLSTLEAAYPGANARVIKRDIVGPRFASDLREGAILAVFFSLLVIFIYIAVRFEWRFGLGAVGAVLHDVLIVFGLFALLHHILPFSLQIDQAIIAAFLTIVGYSINDTVVVFDRIREDLAAFKGEDLETVMDRAISNTLSRTVVTSGTTLIVVGVLFIFGGDVLRGFAFVLMVGIVVGTYSSIFIASPIAYELRTRFAPKPKATPKVTTASRA
jgi:preprotein translocase SecF subunit